MISIVSETADQYDAVRQLTIDAFAKSAFGHSGEADLIMSSAWNAMNALSLVALDDERVIGHVMFSPATICCDAAS